MRFSPLVLAPALSAAILLPPGLSAGEDLTSEKFDSTAESFSRLVRVPCDGCPYKEEGVDTDLIFDFSVAIADPSVLKLNGATVLPINPLEPFDDIKAPQVPHNVSTEDFLSDRSKYEEISMDYNLMTRSQLVLTEGGYKHNTVELRVTSVSGRAVELYGLRMNVREDLESSVLAPEDVQMLPKEAAADCTGFACALNRILSSLRGHKKPCTKGKPHHRPKIGVPVQVSDKEGDDDEHPAPPHHKPHHHHGHMHGHGHHGPHHGMFARIVHKILLPIFVGIVAGLTVSVLGLVVGHVALMGYRKVRAHHHCRRERSGRREGCFGRRRRERMERRRREQEEADESAKGLLKEEDEVEAPPAYVDEGLEVVEKE